MELQVRRAIEVSENGDKVFYLEKGFLFSLKQVKKLEKKGGSFGDLVQMSTEGTLATLFEQAREKGFEPVENAPIEVIVSLTPDFDYTAIVRTAFKMPSEDFQVTYEG